MERRSSLAEEFMTNWRSGVFRDKCAQQIDSVRSKINPRADSDDPMERFFAQNSTVQLEEFVYNKSKTREDYVSLIAEMVMMLRQHGGKPVMNSRLNQMHVQRLLKATTVACAFSSFRPIDDSVVRFTGAVSLGVDISVLESASPQLLASAGVTPEGLERIRQEANKVEEKNGEKEKDNKK